MNIRDMDKFKVASELIRCVPTNWCDPLLTGPTKILPDDNQYSPADIERLLIAIRNRMQKAIELQEEASK